MKKQKTKSEVLFEKLLKKRGFEFIKGEDFFEEGKKCPDYYVKTAYGDLICEVKEFNEPEIHKMIRKQKVIAFSSKRILNPIKNKINAASDQLKPYTKNKIPMIVILSNPYGYFVDLSNEEILSAMFGEIGISIPLIDGKEANWFFGRNGILTSQKQYISAICVLEYLPIKSKKIDEISKKIKDNHKDEETTSELFYEMASEFLVEVESIKKKGLIRERKALRLRVFHNVRANIKLPIEVFNSRYDEHFTYDVNKNSYMLK
jgi:hypothetical protein